MRRRKERTIPGLLVVPGDSHPFASSSCRGFDHHRVAWQQQDIRQIFRFLTAVLLTRKCMYTHLKVVLAGLFIIECKTKKLIRIMKILNSFTVKTYHVD